MASEEVLTCITLPANADLSSYQYHCVDINTSGNVAVLASQGAKVLGVIQNKPAAAGRGATVCIFGVTKAELDGTVTVGDELTSAATGGVEEAASGDYVIGRALESGVSGDIISILFLGSGGYVKA